MGRRNRREWRASRGPVPALTQRKQLMSALGHEPTSAERQRLRVKLQVGLHPERRLGNPGWGMAGDTGNCKRPSTNSGKSQGSLDARVGMDEVNGRHDNGLSASPPTRKATQALEVVWVCGLGLSILIMNRLPLSDGKRLSTVVWLSGYELSAAFTRTITCAVNALYEAV